MSVWKGISIGLVIVIVILGGVTALSLSRTPQEITVTRTLERTQTVTQDRTVTNTVTIAQTPQTMTSVKFIVQTAKSPTWLAFYVAEELGYFQQEGIKVESAILPGDSAIVPILSGEAQFVISSFQVQLNAILRGGELRVLTYTMEGSANSIVAKPDIKKVEDLNGKKIGSEIPGSGTYQVISELIKRYNLKAEQVPFDTAQARATALEAGRIDAMYATSSLAIQLAEKGYNILITQHDIVPLPDSYLATNVKTIKERPDLVLGITRAIMRSVAYIKSVPQGTMEIIVKRIELSPKQAESFYQTFNKLYTNEFNIEKFQKTIDNQAQSIKVSPKPVGEFVDLSFYQRIVKQGL